MSENMSGLSAEEYFARGQGHAYSGFTTLDTIFTNVDRKDISLATDLGKGVVLQTPLIASPMDTVTNSRICIGLAQQGGIGVIHFNYKKADGSPDIGAQIDEIRRVKREQNGLVEDPITISPEMSIAEVVKVIEAHKTEGLHIQNFPVTDNGQSNGKLVGLLRKQDYLPGFRVDSKVYERMIPLKDLKTAIWPITLEEAVNRIWDEHLQILPILDKGGNLAYLATRSDIEKREQFPLATKDSKGRLRVLFAVNTWPESYDRLVKGFDAGADGVVVDTSQGFDKHSKDMLLYIGENYPDKLLIGGNISTKEAAIFLRDLEVVDAYRNGQGPGSICTTENIIGASRAAATSVYECARELRGSNLKTIADGSLSDTGPIFKALALGAHACMLGGLFAGVEEGPGDVKVDDQGSPYKDYWGMGSKKANVGGKRGYTKRPEGRERVVEYKGSIHLHVPLLRDGLTHAFEVKNARNIQELHRALYSGNLRFEYFTGERNGADA